MARRDRWRRRWADHVVNDTFAVTCNSPPGVGTNLSVIVVVNRVASDAYNSSLSYDAPMIESLSGVGAVNAPTTGGVVVITGRNFGPAVLSAVDAVSYAPVGLPGSFAASCAVTVDDVAMRCSTPGGVGSRLLWTVTVCGLSSSNPRTGYLGPVVTDIAVADAAVNSTLNRSLSSLNSLRTDGSQLLVLSGDYFGPTAPRVPLTLSGVGWTVGAAAAVVSTTACTVTTPHVVVTCQVPPGVGTGFVWTLSVAGQMSTSAHSLQSSYGPPEVTVVTVSDATDTSSGTATVGGAQVVVTGVNFGRVPSDFVVMWNGAVVPDVRVSTPYSAIVFSSLASAGGDNLISLSVGGQRVVSSPVVVVSSKAPTVSSLLLDAPSTSSSFSCPTDDAVMYDGSTAMLHISGSNFGTGAATTVSVDDTPCAVDWSRYSHSVLYCTTPRCGGAIVVTVAGQASTPFPYTYERLVALPSVTDFSPRSGPTRGGTVVTILGSQFQYDGSVVFVNGDGSVVGPCEWRTNGTYQPQMIR